MNLSLEISGRVYQIDLNQKFDLSIPLDFAGAQPNAFGVAPARAAAYQTADLIGDTRRGGSCNFEEITFIPHCNGTHTESIGHITDQRISIRECLRDVFIPATLISVAPVKAEETGETYAAELDAADFLITRGALENALENADDNFLRGLIIRTLPNEAEKKYRRYNNLNPPFFSSDAMRYLVEKSIEHLLIDLPSIDKTRDGGRLANHRIFWNVAADSKNALENSFFERTVTELIYVSDEITDGAYLLNLQIASFESDASPSRPLIFGII